MKYTPIDKTLFVKNRKKLSQRLQPGAVAILNSNDIMPTSADGIFPFKQDANFIYLSGIDQEESILVLAPEFPDPRFREILFIKETSEEIAIWEGPKLTKEEASKISGIKTVMWLSAFEQTFSSIMSEAEYVYLDSNEHIRSSSPVETRTDRFNKWCQKTYPIHKYERLAPKLTDLRCVKEPEEIEQIKHACDITEHGFRRVIECVKPGVWEYELEAEFSYEFLKRRSAGFAYDPIIASGNSSCVLHYTQNNKQCKAGDLILFDVAAEYANYNADMTRVLPVSGQFSKRQRAVYDAVLRVKVAATELLVPGNSIPEYHKIIGQIMEQELLTLKLISKHDIEKQSVDNPAYKKYFMHGTSHHLGLNVHDVASIYKKFEPGMVLTVEPGIYIREEGFGIRLEDNVVIEQNGQKNLMKNIPIHADEIESLMNK